MQQDDPGEDVTQELSQANVSGTNTTTVSDDTVSHNTTHEGAPDDSSSTGSESDHESENGHDFDSDTDSSSSGSHHTETDTSQSDHTDTSNTVVASSPAQQTENTDADPNSTEKQITDVVGTLLPQLRQICRQQEEIFILKTFLASRSNGGKLSSCFNIVAVLTLKSTVVVLTVVIMQHRTCSWRHC